MSGNIPTVARVGYTAASVVFGSLCLWHFRNFSVTPQGELFISSPPFYGLQLMLLEIFTLNLVDGWQPSPPAALSLVDEFTVTYNIFFRHFFVLLCLFHVYSLFMLCI